MTPARARPAVAVFGSARLQPDDAEYVEARDLGRLLATAGAEVLTGGYDGAMAAVSEGAHEAGGHVVGVTMAGWADRRGPNPWVAEERPAERLTERIELLVAADAWVAVAGGVGTLSEVSVAWNTLQSAGARRRPLVLMGARWAAIAEQLGASLVVDERDLALVELAPDPPAVMDRLAGVLETPRPSREAGRRPR